MTPTEINLIINIIIFLVVLIGSIIFIFRMKVESKGYKLFFISYIFFWIPLKMLREYTSVIQQSIDTTILWLPLAAYGFVGIFCRPLVDWLSVVLKNRKVILYLAIGIGIVSFIPMIFTQTTATNTIQTAGVGIGASMIGTYELMFKEQYAQKKSFFTVSVMAIPPLLADFVSAPIQSLVSSLSRTNSSTLVDPTIMSYLWIIGIVFYLITLVMVILVKEDRSKVGYFKTNKIVKQNSSGFLFVGLICFVGALVTFIKFSNSGATATATLQLLTSVYNQTNPNDYIDLSNIQAYVSVLFTIFQLAGTLFLQMVLIKKMGKNWSFLVGLSLWIIFHLSIAFYTHPYFYFGMTVINGFSYGVLYNLILAYVLSMSFEKNKISPMGIYQGILAIGITASSFFTSFLRAQFTSLENNLTINLIIVGCLLLSGILYLLIVQIDKKTHQINLPKKLLPNKRYEY